MKKVLIALTSLSLLVTNCTNVDEGIYDRLPADQFYGTPEGAATLLPDLYGQLRGTDRYRGIAGADRGWYDLQEITSDEMMIPTRSDGAWDDGGVFRQLYLHQWTASHEFFNPIWNWGYESITKNNRAIDLMVEFKANEATLAEAKITRAYFYYMLIDMFGNVPFYTVNNKPVEQIPQTNRAEIYNFIVSEILANVDKLPSTKGGNMYGRFNKWAAYAFLAKMYLNAEVYTGTPRYTECLAICDKIINEGGFSLVAKDKYLSDLFKDVCSTDEAIFALYVEANKAPRNMIGIRTLHSNHGNAVFKVSTWNGATVDGSFVDKFEDTDIRKTQWLLGQQKKADGTDIPDVVYTKNIGSFTAAPIYAGARNSKFLPAGEVTQQSGSNDIPVYRYADILLMKAECMVRGGNAAGAKALVDQVRTRAGASTLASAPTLDDIYDERGRELCWEGHRRQDMIRFDKFNLAHDFKSASAAKYKLFPIPAMAISSNPSLVQNPGY
jgi:hypothetical protein